MRKTLNRIEKKWGIKTHYKTDAEMHKEMKKHLPSLSKLLKMVS